MIMLPSYQYIYCVAFRGRADVMLYIVELLVWLCVALSIMYYTVDTEIHFFSFFQPIAVEVFSGDGRNYLLAFQKGIRNKVYQR